MNFEEVVRLIHEIEWAADNPREAVILFGRESPNTTVAANEFKNLVQELILVKRDLFQEIHILVEHWVEGLLHSIMLAEFPQSTDAITEWRLFTNLINSLRLLNPSEVNTFWTSEDDLTLAQVKMFELLKLTPLSICSN